MIIKITVYPKSLQNLLRGRIPTMTFRPSKKAGQKRRDADDAIIESAAQLRLINESVARAMADSVRASRQARLANWIASGSLLIALASLIAAVLALLK